MKTCTIILLFLFGFSIASAQEPIQFFGHQEDVKPSMNAEYLAWLKKIRSEYEKTQVDISYSVLAVDDNAYYFFSPMASPYDLNGIFSSFQDAENKIGKEAIEKLYVEKGAYINTSREFITQLIPQYTYLSPGEGENFRHMMFWFPIPGKEDEAHQIAREWIELHKSRKASNGYQTFQTVFGDEPGWVIVTWGKDEIDLLTKSKETNQLFGEAGSNLWERTMKITQKIYHKKGWFLPDLGYAYKPVAAK
jgi:hypothetical protein